MMTSPIHESESYDRPYPRGSKSSIFHTGVLLLEDAERAPEYLRITIDSDPDEPDPVDEKASESEEDVVVLGVRRPTYQEITLEEDDEGEVNERVNEVEYEKEEPPLEIVEEPLYECTHCDKSFRVESLLKFHIKMHNTIPIGPDEDPSLRASTSVHGIERTRKDKPRKKRHSFEIREKSGQKVASKTSHKHKSRHEKHKSHKHRKHTTSQSE